MLSPLISPEALDLVVSLGRQGVVGHRRRHVSRPRDRGQGSVHRARLAHPPARTTPRTPNGAGSRDSCRPSGGAGEPRPGDPRHRASCDRTTDAAAMSVSRVQQWIDQQWLVSWQLGRRSPRRSLPRVLLRRRRRSLLAIRPLPCSCSSWRWRSSPLITPDSHTALVLEAIAVWQWLASTDDATDPRVIPMACGCFVPHRHRVDGRHADQRRHRSVLVRWGRRSMLVVVATVGMWAVAFVMNERRAPGNSALTLLGVVTLTALIVVTLLRNTTAEQNSAP